MELNISLHPGQLEVYRDRSRFKAVAAGRRWGKSYLSAVTLLTEAMRTHATVNGRRRSLRDVEVWYVAPTFDQARDIIWALLKNMGRPLVKKTWENDGRILLINGRQIQIKGSDRPDRLRGVGLSHVVLDEYASMRPQVWTEILRPTLADVAGGCLAIGTPMGKNHFFDMWEGARTAKNWAQFHFLSTSNPHLPTEEIAAAKESMPREVFVQEFEASFQSAGKIVFPYDLQICPESDVPRDGYIYMAVDLGGFMTEGQQRQRNSRLDRSALVAVKVTPKGWWVLDCQAGRWEVRETSIRILRMAQQHRPIQVGIEQGIARNAIMPYLTDQARRLQIFPRFTELRHGGKDKASRVAWALQGRMEHKKLWFVDGEWVRDMQEEIHDFPYGRHDDRVDALAYVDQMAKVAYINEMVQDTWDPLDEAVGI